MGRGKGNRQFYNPSVSPHPLRGQQIAQIADLQKINENIMQMQRELFDRIERRSRVVELKQLMAIEELRREIDSIKANQAVTQGMCGNKGVFSSEEFQEAFQAYIQEELGIVDKHGRMSGMVFVDFYNVGAALEPTSAPDSGNNPVYVTNGDDIGAIE